MIPFRERNPVPIGLAGAVLFAFLAVLAFQAGNIPVFNGGGKEYEAHFTEVANLREEDAVRIAGVKVGKVTKIELDGDHVSVKFRLNKGTDVGRLTKASIRIRTILGLEYLQLEPAGEGSLDPDEPIPTTRTTPPFDVVPAFQQLTTTVEEIDTAKLTEALETISDTFEDTAPNVRTALDGLSRVSKAIADRDDQLRQLLENANGVTGVLAARDQELEQLVVQADQVLQMLQQRRETISSLLQNTVTLSEQLSGLAAEQRGQLAPALQNLKGVIDTLNANQANLYRSIQLLGPFARLLNNTVGNGQWFDSYIHNLGPFSGCVQLPASLGGGRAGC